jgi:hypothetical protein
MTLVAWAGMPQSRSNDRALRCVKLISFTGISMYILLILLILLVLILVLESITGTLLYYTGAVGICWFLDCKWPYIGDIDQAWRMWELKSEPLNTKLLMRIAGQKGIRTYQSYTWYSISSMKGAHSCGDLVDVDTSHTWDTLRCRPQPQLPNGLIMIIFIYILIRISSVSDSS